MLGVHMMMTCIYRDKLRASATGTAAKEDGAALLHELEGWERLTDTFQCSSVGFFRR